MSIWVKKRVDNPTVIVHFCASYIRLAPIPKKASTYFDFDFHFLLPLKNCPHEVSQDLNKYIYSEITLPWNKIIRNEAWNNCLKTLGNVNQARNWNNREVMMEPGWGARAGGCLDRKSLDGSVQGLGVPCSSWPNPSPRDLSQRANGHCNSSHKLLYSVGAEQLLTDKGRSASQASYLIFCTCIFYINPADFLLNFLFFALQL